MAYVSRRRLVAALVSILFIILLAGCGGAPETTSPPNSGSHAPSQQDLYRAELAKDYQSLDRGVLSYSQLGSPKTAVTTQFEVTVTDVGRGPQLTRVTESGGMNVYQQDVPTGGIVGVQIVKCSNLTCSSESDLRQPVLDEGQAASWWWSVTAGTPGPASITLRADTYDQGSTQSLSEEIINVNVQVVSTPAFSHQQTHKKIVNTTKSVVSDVETIGSIAGAIVAVGGIVGWLATRRRNRNGKGKSHKRVTAHPGEPRRPRKRIAK